MDVAKLRLALHEAVDRIVDDFVAAESRPAEVGESRPARSGGPQVAVERGDDNGPWTYRWPSGGEEAFAASRWYEIDDGARTHRVLVARTTREAWGRTDRWRVIVFGQQGSATSTTFYPWTEFVETDDGRYAAPIPRPERPRAMLVDGDRLPPEIDPRLVDRSDRLFRRIAEGPSLRFVLDDTDEAAMVRHGYWVAALRNRL